MNHPTRIPVLKKALTALRRGETDPQLRLGIMREDIFEALIPLFERELRTCLIEEQDRHRPMDKAIERALEQSSEEYGSNPVREKT